VWDARTGELSHVLTGHFGAVQDARFSPDGRWVVTAGPITAGLWNARTGELVRYLRGPTSALIAAAFTDNDTIVTSEADGSRRQAGCTVCGELPALLALADARLGRAGRQLTPQEREQYLG
jgi:WD40 repeat protein